MLKRDLHLFLRCLIPAAVFAAALAVVCAAAGAAVAQGSEKVYTPVKAAVVDGEDTLLSRMLIRGVAEVDYIKQLLEVEVCSAPEAEEGLGSGEFVAVIELPENFIDDILRGEEKRGRITLSGAVALNSDVIAGVAAFGELLLASGQYAAFSTVTVIDSHIEDWELGSRILDRANSSLLGEAISASEKYFTFEVTDYAGSGVSLAAHYAVSWLAALLALSAVMFERLYVSDRSRSMLLRLKGAGVSDGKFLVWKVLLPMGFLLVLLLSGAFVLSRWLEVDWSFVSICGAVAAAAVPAVMAAALLLSLDKGALALMMLSVVSIFLCGGIVPREMLHSALLAAGDLTPLGVSRALLLPLFGGRPALPILGGAAFWLACGPVMALVRLKRLRLKGGA